MAVHAHAPVRLLTCTCAGAGPRLNIIAAAKYVCRRGDRERVHAELIRESLRIWQAGGKAHNAENASDRRAREGRVNAVLRNNTGSFGGDAVSSGMNADTFFRWFTDLVEYLGREHSEDHVCIQLDNAKYHKTRHDPPPSSNANKHTLLEWLHRHGDDTLTRSDSKQRILEAVRQKGEGTKYRIVQLAEAHSIRVIFTPPYHPELQPIECVWAVVKQPFQLDPPLRMSDLAIRLTEYFKTRVDERVLLGAWKRSAMAENIYNSIREKAYANALDAEGPSTDSNEEC